MQPLQQKQGEQGCPNLDAQRVLAGADKALDLEVLFERLEEQLDLPALAVDGGQGGGPKLQMVGQKDDLALLFIVPDDDATQPVGALLPGSGACQTNDLVGQDGAPLRQASVCSTS